MIVIKILDKFRKLMGVESKMDQSKHRHNPHKVMLRYVSIIANVPKDSKGSNVVVVITILPLVNNTTFIIK